jgi:hypothetical protein
MKWLVHGMYMAWRGCEMLYIVMVTTFIPVSLKRVPQLHLSERTAWFALFVYSFVECTFAYDCIITNIELEDTTCGVVFWRFDLLYCMTCIFLSVILYLDMRNPGQIYNRFGAIYKYLPRMFMFLALRDKAPGIIRDYWVTWPDLCTLCRVKSSYGWRS